MLQPRALPTLPAERRQLAIPESIVAWARGLVHWPTEGQTTFALGFAAYLMLGGVLALTLHSIVGDAWSRLGNAYYVLFSRDPHLAAIGFVWNPLPSLVMLPLLPLKAIFPALVTEGFAANIVSAAFMAGAVVQLLGLLRDLGLSRPARWTLSAGFALHPMIVLYGANGMSEAMFLFFLLLTARHLMRWLQQDGVGSLAGAGIALAFAYLTRYEAAAAAAVCVAAVALLSSRAAPRGSRLTAGLADAAIVGAPFLLAFVTWAAASWIIVGSPFEIFTSLYGNSAQIARAGDSISQATGAGLNGLAYATQQISALFPYLVPVAVAAVSLALWRADRRVIGPLAVFGGILLFALGAFLIGKTFGWLRFYIAVVPLGVVLAGLVASPAVSSSRLRATLDHRVSDAKAAIGISPPAVVSRATRLLVTTAVTLAVVGAAALAIPSALAGMQDPSLGRGETSEQLSALLPMGRGAEQYSAQAFAAGGAAAAYLDGLNLPDGSVLADAATAFPIVLQSAHPRQFVITPDRDFEQTVADPSLFKVRYVVVSTNVGGDAVARAFPGMYENGAGIGELAGEFREGPFVWRVYRLRDRES